MITPEQLHRDLESLLERDPYTILGDESLDQIDWDSMSVVMFIALADQNYSVAVAPGKLANAKTVAALYDLVSSPS